MQHSMKRSANESVKGDDVEDTDLCSNLTGNPSDLFKDRSSCPRKVSGGSSVASCPTDSIPDHGGKKSEPVSQLKIDERMEGDVHIVVAVQNHNSTTESSKLEALSLPRNRIETVVHPCRKVSFSGLDGYTTQSALMIRGHAPNGSSMTQPSSTNSLQSLGEQSDSETTWQCEVSLAGNDDILSSATKRMRVEHTPSGVSSPSIGMLAQPDDSSILNAFHIFVRQQIEVFTAGSTEMALPAPGRKTAIRLHQVGLRCIHCKDLAPKDRVKRAACYPSGVGRVYHSVSDMKFDHFPNCKGFSPHLRAKFIALKVDGQRGGDKRTNGASSSSTAQYYHDAALRMGMEDRGEGIFMTGQLTQSSQTRMLSPQMAMAFSNSMAPDAMSREAAIQFSMRFGPSNSVPSFPCIPGYNAPMTSFPRVTHGFDFRDSSVPAYPKADARPNVITPQTTEKPTSGVPLGTLSDLKYLNPLHCFVRRNVEVFVATNEDIAAPSPGRKNRVVVGQVGIRCIHCAKLPPSSRVKRAVCYPPSVGAIYHSVSNMKFDHFGGCRGLPDEARKEFSGLRSSFNRRGGSTQNVSRTMSNSTAQYYHDSAMRLGLRDSANGIQFAFTPSANCYGSGVFDRLSALMQAAREYDQEVSAV